MVDAGSIGMMVLWSLGRMTNTRTIPVPRKSLSLRSDETVESAVAESVGDVGDAGRATDVGDASRTGGAIGTGDARCTGLLDED
jgi:hypothetical protein